jgi:hypothetical protein
MRITSDTFLNSMKFCVSIFYLIVSGSCIVQFVPELVEDQDLLVVEGLITDQPGPNTVKLSKSLPLGTMSSAIPLGGCSVQISDDLGNYYNLYETGYGIYTTDSASFQGVIGRSYTLHIGLFPGYRTLSYESSPMEMKPVPPIDSIYYEKKIIKESVDGWFGMVPNMTCWVTENAKRVNVKNASSIQEASVNKHPITYISNATDRLKIRYSILVTQHSLSEEENCINDTIYGDFDPPELNVTAWTLIDHPEGIGPRERVLTYRKACADCTTRGTTIKPD